MPSVTHTIAARNLLGEGPLWHPTEQRLYWIDIEGRAFFHWDPQSGLQERFPLAQQPGCLAFLEGGDLLLATSDGLGVWRTETASLHLLTDNIAFRPATRFNDGAVDCRGRFWAGTMSQEPVNALYRLDPDGQVHIMAEGLTIPNGLGWSPDRRTMYHCDSGTHTIYAYDFEPDSGAISNRRVWFSNAGRPDTPDGLTVDSEGYIWAAHWNGWKVVRYTPDGRVDREIPMPVQYPTSCAFGGPDLDTLYITSASIPLSNTEKQEQPLAGDIFSIKPGVRGLPEPFARLDRA